MKATSQIRLIYRWLRRNQVKLPRDGATRRQKLDATKVIVIKSRRGRGRGKSQDSSSTSARNFTERGHLSGMLPGGSHRHVVFMDRV